VACIVEKKNTFRGSERKPEGKIPLRGPKMQGIY
jgi:hypothetical protein